MKEYSAQCSALGKEWTTYKSKYYSIQLGLCRKKLSMNSSKNQQAFLMNSGHNANPAEIWILHFKNHALQSFMHNMLIYFMTWWWQVSLTKGPAEVVTTGDGLAKVAYLHLLSSLHCSFASSWSLNSKQKGEWRGRGKVEEVRAVGRPQRFSFSPPAFFGSVPLFQQTGGRGTSAAVAHGMQHQTLEGLEQAQKYRGSFSLDLGLLQLVNSWDGKHGSGYGAFSQLQQSPVQRPLFCTSIKGTGTQSHFGNPVTSGNS